MEDRSNIAGQFKNYDNFHNGLMEMLLRSFECVGHGTGYYDYDPVLHMEDLAQADEREQQLYFYHPDHLGSSAFITDADGEAHQHMQYLPFGESFVFQKVDWETRYTFSAKWLSVDPKASGYPGISAYAYCYNNPMNFIDKWGLSPSDGGPGGQNPELEEKDGNGNQTQYYGNGKVLTYPSNSSSNSNTNESRGSSNDVNCDNEFASINNYSFLDGRDQSIQSLTNRDLAIIFKDSYIDTKRHLETNGIGQQNLDKEDYGLWVLENIHLEPDEEHSYLGYAVINAIVFRFEGDDNYTSFGNIDDTRGKEEYPFFTYGSRLGMPKSLMYIYFKDGNKVHKARIQWVITMPLYAN